jgi:hypothetical protein
MSKNWVISLSSGHTADNAYFTGHSFYFHFNICSKEQTHKNSLAVVLIIVLFGYMPFCQLPLYFVF